MATAYSDHVHIPSASLRTDGCTDFGYITSIAHDPYASAAAGVGRLYQRCPTRRHESYPYRSCCVRVPAVSPHTQIERHH
jgi:hypothetical protein